MLIATFRKKKESKVLGMRKLEKWIPYRKQTNDIVARIKLNKIEFDCFYF